MGTRTYSRRASNGTRIPTALGIRTGRFTQPNTAFSNLVKRFSYTPTGIDSDRMNAAITFTSTVPASQYTNRNERFYQYDQDGTLIYEVGGGTDYIQLNDKILIANQNRSWMGSHNHPSYLSSFSPPDIRSHFVRDTLLAEHMHVRSKKLTSEEREVLTDFLNEFDVNEILTMLPSSDKSASWVINPEVFRRALTEHIETIKNPNVVSMDVVASRQSVEQGKRDGDIWVDRLYRELNMPSVNYNLMEKFGEYSRRMNAKRVSSGRQPYTNIDFLLTTIFSEPLARSIVEANNLGFAYTTLYNSEG